MSGQRFNPGQVFKWQEELYEVRQLLAGDQVNLVKLRSGATQAVTAVQLVQALLTGELEFVTQTVLDPRPTPSEPLTLADYTEVQRAVVEYRLEIIRPFLALPPQERRQAIKARVQELRRQRHSNTRTLDKAVSMASIYRWIRAYTDSQGDPRSLVPQTTQRGGQHTTRLQADTEAIVKATIDDHYYVREHRTIDYMHREVAVRIEAENQRRRPSEQLKLPSRATLARRLNNLEVQATLEAKQGRRATRRYLTQYQATAYPTIPLERVEIDHTRTDLIVIDEHDHLPLGRLRLTYALDTATRYPLGYYLGFEPPSYLAVRACLHHMIWPKAGVQTRYSTQHDWLAYGIPYTLVVDNGKEFIGRDLTDACHLLGVILQQMPVQTPYFKASIERMFGTVNTGLLHTLPGTTFSNPGQRGNYDSLQQACITLADLEQILHLFLLDIYAENFHRGLQDIPARRWEQLTRNGFFPRLPASATELAIFLGRVVYRTIQPYGIDLHTLRYNCADLSSLRTRMHKRADPQVKVKYDPADLSRIHVYDPDEQCYREVPALAQAYTQGLSLWKHKVIRNFVLSQQETVDIVALGQAQRQIQAIVEAGLQRKQLGMRTKIARWQNERSTNAEKDISSQPSPTQPAVTPPLAPVLDFELNLDPEKLAAEGWQVSYDLPEMKTGGL